MSNVISERIGLSGSGIDLLQRSINRYTLSDYESGTLHVRRVLDSDEVSLRFNRPSIKVEAAVPKAASSFDLSYYPKFLYLYLTEDVEPSSVSSSINLKVNDSSVTNTVTLIGTRIIKVAHTYVPGAVGHYVFTFDSGITSISGNALQPFTWDMKITSDPILNDPGESEFFLASKQKLFIKRISIGRHDTVELVLRPLFRDTELKIIDFVYQEYDHPGPTLGNVYILYTYTNSFFIKRMTPTRDSVIAGLSTKIAVDFEKTVETNSNFHNRVFVTTSTDQDTYTVGTSSFWERNYSSSTITLHANANIDGLHFYKIYLQDLVSKDGQVWDGYPWLYNCYYINARDPMVKEVSVISDLADVSSATPSDTYVLTWDAGTSSWIPAAPSGGGGGGAPTNATYLTLSTNATLTQERVLTMGSAKLVTVDGGAGGNLTLDVAESQIVHGNLAGLSSGDPHSQYILVNGSRAFSAPVAGVAPGGPNDLVTRSYLETGGGGGPGTGHFLVVHSDASLTNERALTFNGQFAVVDGGAGGQYTVGLKESQVIHGNLAGLSSGDPHTQYSLVDGTRAFSGPVAGVAPGSPSDLVTRTYFETGVGNGGTGHYLMVHNDSRVQNGRAITFNNQFLVADGGAGGQYTVAVKESQIIHGNLAGLSSGDPHTQYSLVDGTRAFSGPVGGVSPGGPSDLITRNYFETGVGHGGTGHYLMVHNDVAVPNGRAITFSDMFGTTDGGSLGQYNVSIKETGVTHTGTYLAVGTDARFANSRALTMGSTKLRATDAGALSSYSLDVAEANINHGNLGGLDTGNPHTGYYLRTAIDFALFGDGSDGDVTAGSITLTRDMYYHNLTIDNATRITTASFKIFVSGTLTIGTAAATAISASGGNGSASSGTGSGAAGGASTVNTVGAGGGGTAGPAGGTTTGSQATAPTNQGTANGGAGGAGGTGGNGTSGAGGAARSGATVANQCLHRRHVHEILRGATLLQGGAGGGGGGSGGGDGTAGGGGGGGAAGGRVLYIAAKTINTTDGSAAAACIQAKGGTGGAGGTPAAGARGGGAGGGGGGGGYVYIIYYNKTGSSIANAIDASGGNGGNAGLKTGAGTDGTPGAGGGGGNIILLNMSTNTSTVVAGSSGSAGVGTTGGTGGACKSLL